MAAEDPADRLLRLPEAGWPRQYGCRHTDRVPLPGTTHRYRAIYRWERCVWCLMSIRSATREFGIQRERD